MQAKAALSLIATALLAGCGASTDGAVRSASSANPQRVAVRQPARTPLPTARVLALPGLEGVIGADRAGLIRQFGPARLDVWEGDARKLQFSGTACVLDVFLYPAERGAEPQATYVDARRASDGQDVDRAACVAALAQR